MLERPPPCPNIPSLHFPIALYHTSFFLLRLTLEFSSHLCRSRYFSCNLYVIMPSPFLCLLSLSHSAGLQLFHLSPCTYGHMIIGATWRGVEGLWCGSTDTLQEGLCFPFLLCFISVYLFSRVNFLFTNSYRYRSMLYHLNTLFDTSWSESLRNFVSGWRQGFCRIKYIFFWTIH